MTGTSSAEITGAATGLTSAEVAERVAAGRVNLAVRDSSRSVAEILRANLFTLFNAILGTALVVVLLVGDLQDAVFGFVLVFNALIGVVGEVRAKRVLDRLAILDAPEARVVRDGAELRIDATGIVVDDVVLLGAGDQVPVDATVLTSAGLEVDESLLTGESEPVVKETDDEVLSGSLVVAGSARVLVLRVGADSYANRLTAEARRFSLVHSELRDGINKVLVVLTWVIVPVTVLLTWSQLRAQGGVAASLADGSWREAVVSAVAGVVGMVPEGLVLLTSINFALAAVILARRMVLVQELPAVEVLARVDTLCLDKTGTLTDGSIVAERVVELAEVDGAAGALAAMAADAEGNATARALAGVVEVVRADTVSAAVPFSSARKWSSVTTAHGTWLLGAPEVVLAGVESEAAGAALATVTELASDGARVVLLARAEQADLSDGALPAELQPVSLVVLREQIRSDAAQTLAYFREQGVDLKVISGDNPATVAAIATAVDLAGDGADIRGTDARTLPEDADALAEVMAGSSVFGRVTPEQKRAMVHALQRAGRTVAMTGDGVNDAMALKDADLGIAMGSGARATKSVARLVLMDDSFASLPGVVAEGRRVIANMERVSNLFLTKTTYAALLAVVVALLAWPYPFLPRHLTLVGSLTIGIPAFLIALAPNAQRYRPGFLRRVLTFAVPSGVVAAASVLAVYGTLHLAGLEDVAKTGATLVLVCVGLWVLGVLARPWSWWRVLLVAAMAAGVLLAVLIPWVREFFALTVPTGPQLALVLGVGAVGCLAVEIVHRVVRGRVAAG